MCSFHFFLRFFLLLLIVHSAVLSIQSKRAWDFWLAMFVASFILSPWIPFFSSCLLLVILSWCMNHHLSRTRTWSSETDISHLKNISKFNKYKLYISKILGSFFISSAYCDFRLLSSKKETKYRIFDIKMQKNEKQANEIWRKGKMMK